MKKFQFIKKVFIVFFSILLMFSNIAFAEDDGLSVKLKDEWDFYRKMDYALRNGESKITVYFDDVNDAFSNSYELFKNFIHFTGYELFINSYDLNIDSFQNSLIININFKETKEQMEYVDNEIDKIISQIITPNMNVLDKVKAIHDWIVTNVSYDTTYSRHTSYDALTEPKTAVCQGYTMLAYKMFKKVGIPSIMISSYEMNHAWNLVKVDGKWLHLDITGDDPMGGTKIYYKYFLLTNDEIQNDHTYDKIALDNALKLFGEEASDVNEKAIFVKEFEVNSYMLNMKKGENETLRLTKISPAGANTSNIAWVSFEPNIASVDNNGVVKAQNVGFTAIKVYNRFDPSYFKIIFVFVDPSETRTSTTNSKSEITAINLNKTSVVLSKGKSYTVTVTNKIPSQDLIWESSNKKIAIVDKKGKIIGVGRGKTTIKVRLKQNPKVYRIVNVVVK